MIRSSLVLLSLLAVLGLQAQTVFIPDLQFRAELNQRVPGLVPANGQMPVNNDAMVPATIFLIIDWTPCDLTGLEYLQGLVSLDLQFLPGATTSTLPVLPPTLRIFKVTNYPANVVWPVLPSMLNDLFVDGTERPDLPAANGGFFKLDVRNAMNVTEAPVMASTISEFRMSNTGITSVDIQVELLYVASLMDNPFLTDVTLRSEITDGQCAVEISTCPALTTIDIHGTYSLYLTQLPALTTIVPLDDQLDLLWCLTVPSLPVVPDLPVSLTSLIVSEAPVTVIPTLPPNLRTLSVISCQNTVIPDLPATLSDLTIMTCPLLQAIPTLPAALDYLSLRTLPLISELPLLPGTLSRLSLESMPVPILPNIPESLDFLELIGLETTELPPLAAPITYLMVRDCPLGWIPELPSTLITLQLMDLPLKCLPWLPMGLTGLGVSNTPVTCQPNHPPSANTVFPLCTILNSYCPEPAPYVEGTLFWDDNGNGVQDPEEAGIPNTTVFAAPYGYMTGTDSAGHYSMAVPLGTHAFTALDGAYQLELDPAEVTVTATSLDTIISGVDLAAQLDTIVPDLSITGWWAMALRPGSYVTHTLRVSNAGSVLHNVEIRLTLDPDVQLVDCAVPALVEGNELVWTLDSLALGEELLLPCIFYMATQTPLGTIISMIATIGPEDEDINPLDNTYTEHATVLGSFDPNDKQVSPSTLTIEEGMDGSSVDYLIRFQNTGTASALRVLVTDTLDAMLDPLTFQLEGTTHPCSWFFREGALHFLFEDIDLPDSTTNEPGSHGAIRFNIKTRPGLLPGTVVPNLANIYFDFNEPVITEPCDLTVLLPESISTQDAGDIHLYPTPTKGLLNLRHNGIWTDATITLTNALGSVVLRDRVTGPTMTLDLSKQPTGVYLLRVDNETRSWSRKVVKE